MRFSDYVDMGLDVATASPAPGVLAVAGALTLAAVALGIGRPTGESELEAMERRLLAAIRDRDHAIVGYRQSIENESRARMMKAGRLSVAPTFLVLGSTLRKLKAGEEDPKPHVDAAIALTSDLAQELAHLGIPTSLSSMM